jgi:hypothetical protein
MPLHEDDGDTGTEFGWIDGDRERELGGFEAALAESNLKRCAAAARTREPSSWAIRG